MKVAFVTSAALRDSTADDRLAAEALAGLGVAVEPAVWDDAKIDWRRFDALVLRSTWDYHRRVGAFLAWLAAREAEGATVENAPSLVRWNCDKRYLAEIGGGTARLPAVPTRYLRAGEKVDPARLAAELGVDPRDELVLKPTVDATGENAWRTGGVSAARARERIVAMLGRGEVMVQPLVPEIVSVGESSLIFFAGRYSHAVKKRAREGEFRIQVEHGGSIGAYAPPTAVIDAAAETVAAHARDALYARVDLVETASGPLLMELELIEPELCFRFDPASPARFAEALRARLPAPRPA